MTCPECGSKTRVIDSRSHEDSKHRRRECEECHKRFNTIEIDADYYETLKPVDKKAIKYAIADILLETYTEFARKVYNALKIEERNIEDEVES